MVVVHRRNPWRFSRLAKYKNHNEQAKDDQRCANDRSCDKDHARYAEAEQRPFDGGDYQTPNQDMEYYAPPFQCTPPCKVKQRTPQSARDKPNHILEVSVFLYQFRRRINQSMARPNAAEEKTDDVRIVGSQWIIAVDKQKCQREQKRQQTKSQPRACRRTPNNYSRL